MKFLSLIILLSSASAFATDVRLSSGQKLHSLNVVLVGQSFVGRSNILNVKATATFTNECAAPKASAVRFTITEGGKTVNIALVSTYRDGSCPDIYSPVEVTYNIPVVSPPRTLGGELKKISVNGIEATDIR